MHFSFKRRELKKLYPLTISRGTYGSSENLFVTIGHEGLSGIGELAPAESKGWTCESGERQLRKFLQEGGLSIRCEGAEREILILVCVEDTYDFVNRFSVQQTWERMREAGIDPPAMAALDVALWDLHAKRAGLPLFSLFGLSPRSKPTSLTIGLNPPEITRERVPEILSRTRAKFLKIKLGSPAGREYDKAHFEAAREASAPFKVGLRVDANGGWTPDEAVMMIAWLAERGVEYVEQPLVDGGEDGLPYVFERRKLPIFIDESCRFSQDVAKFAHCVDGVNLKLMKCGGLTEAMRIVATARAHGLKTMIGCMGESSVAIAAGASIGSLFDYIDLDSHLNLDPDCASGIWFHDGVLMPRDVPGHGAQLCDA